MGRPKKGDALKVGAVVPWYGSNRILAHNVGKAMGTLKWCGVAFAGGMTEIPEISSNCFVVNDLHRHVINLARVIADPSLSRELRRRLRLKLFHVDELREAQARCVTMEALIEGDGDRLFANRSPLQGLTDDVRLRWAEDYFVSAWMSRHGAAGSANEFNATMSIRWKAGGGDSAIHFHSAVRSIRAWQRIFTRCNFETMDALDFIDKAPDEPLHGLYLDPPFRGPGDKYKVRFSEPQHRQMASKLTRFGKTRVVCRFYEHPLVREIYPEGDWTYQPLEGRKGTNEKADELLVVRNAA